VSAASGAMQGVDEGFYAADLGDLPTLARPTGPLDRRSVPDDMPHLQLKQSKPRASRRGLNLRWIPQFGDILRLPAQ
jgi:hypothetical protein